MPDDNCTTKYRTVASFVTNATVPSRATWDLTPYKTAGIGKPGGTWRLIEVGANLLYAEGKIAADGTLVSYDASESPPSRRSGGGTRDATPSALDDTFVSHYSYDGYMELQVSDPEPECTSCPCPEDPEECCEDE
jgi:hypothetical protein